LTRIDRLLFVWLYRLCPSVLSAVVIVQPETVVRWHRKGFRLYWRWKSRARVGRPCIARHLRRIIRELVTYDPVLFGHDVVDVETPPDLSKPGITPSKHSRRQPRNDVQVDRMRQRRDELVSGNVAQDLAIGAATATNEWNDSERRAQLNIDLVPPSSTGRGPGGPRR